MNGGSVQARRSAELPEGLDWGVRIFFLALLLVLAVLVLTGAVEEGPGGIAAGLVLVGLLVVAIPLSRFAEAESVKAFGVEWAFAQKAMEGAQSANLGESEDEVKPEEAEQIADLQFLLEAKLAYVAKHVIGFGGTGKWAPFLTLGSLEHDGYMTKEDALAARELLTLPLAHLQKIDEAERAAYVKRTKEFVRNIRATIFREVVKQVLEMELDAGVVVRERGKGKRPDFELATPLPGHIRVFPVFAVRGSYWNDKKRIRDRAEELANLTDRALIVVPPTSKMKLDPPVLGVDLVHLDALATATSLDAILPPPAG